MAMFGMHNVWKCKGILFLTRQRRKHDNKHKKAYGIATLLFNVTTETPSASVKIVSLY